jgi:ribosomal protein S18 acetylase RimI-like enzyme
LGVVYWGKTDFLPELPQVCSTIINSGITDIITLYIFGEASVYTIRLASPRDSTALAKMNLEFNHVFVESKDIEKKLRKGNEIVFVALEGNKPIAFICAQLYLSFCYPIPYAEITEIYVKSEHRLKGLGTELINTMELYLVKKEVNHIHILTGQRNKPACALYEGLGYKINRKRSEVLYEKNIK